MQSGISRYQLRSLTKALAQENLDSLTELVNLIPQVEMSPRDLLADKKDDRIYAGKWERSLALFDGDKPIGIIFGYERTAENNGQYPQNTLYISELAVAKSYQKQGLGRDLLAKFLEINKQTGFRHLSGPFNFSVQTNEADWNNPVRGLYESFGFKARDTKQYDNRTDVVMGLDYSS